MSDDTMYLDRCDVPPVRGKVTTGWVLRQGEERRKGVYLVGGGAWQAQWLTTASHVVRDAKVFRTKRAAKEEASILAGAWRPVRLYRRVR